MIAGCLKFGVAVSIVLAVAIGSLVAYLQATPSAARSTILSILNAVGAPAEPLIDDFLVKDESVFFDILTNGNLGMAEGYMHGKVEFKNGPLNIFNSLLNGSYIGTRRAEMMWLTDLTALFALPTFVPALFFNQQTRDKSRRVTEQHYDAGNDLYEVMLGPTMSYTCGYWSKGAKTLEEAQIAKFELVRRKLELKDGMKVAELGCGWGTIAKHVHELSPGTRVTGVSLSKEQIKWANANLATEGLNFVWSDYRDHCEDPKYRGTYDRVYSIGMMEHVGYKNYPSFFKCVQDLLTPEGLAVIHTIGEPNFVPAMDPFLDKYIFPGAVIPALSQLMPAIEKYFILEDYQNFGFDYHLTLDAWSVNAKKFFLDNPDRYSVEFQRMWEYYLRMCQSLFMLRINQLWQFVLSPRPATRARIERVA